MNMEPVLIADAERSGRVLTRVVIPPRSDENEETLQSILYANPALLSLEAAAADDSSRLIPLAREVETASGVLDLLYVDRSGRLTIVETKLIKNPQAHREVITQVIGYAAAVAKLDYGQLNAAVKESRPDGDGKDLDAVLRSIAASEGEAAELRGRIARALRMGDFNLFIVGDRVSEQAQLAAESIGASPTLRFRLLLVELRIYRVGDEPWPWIVIPRMVERIEPVERFVVRIEPPEAAERITVKPVAPREEVEDLPGTSGLKSSKAGVFTSAEDFYLSPELKAGFADRYRAFDRAWLDAGGECRPSARLRRWVFVNDAGVDHWPLNVGTTHVMVIRVIDREEYGVAVDAYAKYRATLEQVPAFRRALSANKVKVKNEEISSDELQVLLVATLQLLPGWKKDSGM